MENRVQVRGVPSRYSRRRRMFGGVGAIIITVALLTAASNAEFAGRARAVSIDAIVKTARTAERDTKAEVADFNRGIFYIADGVPLHPQALRRAADRVQQRRTDKDADIGAMIRAQYLWHGSLKGSSIHVAVQDGVVRLQGFVGSAGKAALAEEFATHTRGVLRVISALEVTARRAAGRGETSPVEAWQELNFDDSWTTTRVKAVIAFDRRLCGSNVQVKTESGVVKLSGMVINAQQGGKLLDIVHDITGVHQVRSEMQLPQVGTRMPGYGSDHNYRELSPLQPAVHSYMVDYPCANAAPAGGPVILM